MRRKGIVDAFFRQYAVHPSRRGTREYTHTFFTGGSFIVPSHEEVTSKLLHAIVCDVRCKVPIFINEIATDVFRFFLDLDFAVSQRLCSSHLASTVEHVHSALTSQFPADIAGRNPRFFETIVLASASPSLCTGVHQLGRMLQPMFADCITITVLDGGRVRDPHAEDQSHAVAWDLKPPNAGVHQCSTCSGVVTLSSGESFADLLAMSPQYKCLLRHGTPPRAVPVAFALTQSAWPYTCDTIFQVTETTHLVNMKYNASGCFKQGLHLIFPEIAVNVEDALRLRNAVVHSLTTRMRDLTADRWDAVVDGSVYAKGKGLRMIGSNKASTCSACCKGSSRDCSICLATGKVDEGRPYYFESLANPYGNDEAVVRSYENVYYQIKRSSIRLQTSIHDHPPRSPRLPSTPPAPKRPPTFSCADSPEARLFEKYLPLFCSEYAGLKVSRVTKVTCAYFVNVVGEGRTFCMNKSPPGRHQSSSIYFQIDKRGICVRCYSHKAATTRCAHFKSPYIALDASDAEKLFR